MECQEASVPLRQLKAVLVEVLEATGSGGTSNALERGRLDDTTGDMERSLETGAFPSLLQRPEDRNSPTVSKDTTHTSSHITEMTEEDSTMTTYHIQHVGSGQSTFEKKRSRLSRGGDVAHHEYAKSFRSSNASHEKMKQTRLQKWLRSNPAEITLAATILISSLLVGFEVQLMSSNLNTSLPSAFVILRMCLNLVFIFELLLRVYAFGCQCCSKGSAAWFWFDIMVVCGSAAETFVDIYGFYDQSLDSMPDFSQVRLLKILRVTRLLRALRVPCLMRYVAPLQTLVSSISHTLWYLVWAAVLLMLLIYTVSIAFAQTVASFIIVEGLEQVEEQKPALLVFWRDLWTSMTTCFMAISGGINWQEVYDPLNKLDAMMGSIFIVFISFAYFALLNILTGVFCNSAMEALSRDPDIVAISHEATYIREHLSHLFSIIDKDCSGHMTLDELEAWMEEENGKVDLQALGIDEGDPWTLFKLLDEDAEGVVSQMAFVDGCLRLRGNASGVDMASLRNESRATQELLSMLVMRIETLDFKKPRRPSYGSRLGLGSPSRPRRHTISGSTHVGALQRPSVAEDITL
ncbi:Ribosomal large subunit pseudouridine synthase D [Durusdinium trenchii]|uniref:Ribosomal large subunit pseudouridine synthase D n=1 Tax=Durusdinium trenchii TaxID=1381693 RepID=A0ABP0KG01_9DINO